MAASNIRAGGAFVELFVNDGAVAKTLASVRKQLTTFGASVRNVGIGVGGLGSSIGAPMAAAVVLYAQAGAAVDDMAQRTGLGAAAVQELSFAAMQSATDIEALEKGLVKMQKTIVEAGEGSKTAREALLELGVTAESLQGESPDEQFELMADGIAAIEDPAKRTSAAMAVFGKGGVDLVPMLSQGSASIEKLRAEARALGIVMDGDAVESAATLDDSIQKLMTTFGGMKNAIGAALAGPATAIADLMVTGATSVINFVNANRDLVVGIAGLAAALVVGGGALVGIGTAIQVAGFAAAGLSTLLAGMAIVFTTPLLLVPAILAAVTLAFPPLRQAAMDTFGFLLGGFTQLGDIVDQTFGGISDALAGGDMQAAAAVLWAGINAAWLQGTENIRQVWRKAVANIAAFGLDVFASFRSAWALTVKFFGDMWDAVVGGMGGTWSNLQNSIASGMVAVLARITGQDPAEMQKSLEEEQAAQRAASAQRMADRQRETSAKLALIAKENTEAKDELAAGVARQNAAAQQEIENAKAALTAERDKASAIKAAAVAKREADTKGKLPGPKSLDSGLSSAFASFSASASSRIGISSTSGLQTAAEKTAENTEKIAENTLEMRPAFR